MNTPTAGNPRLPADHGQNAGIVGDRRAAGGDPSATGWPRPGATARASSTRREEHNGGAPNGRFLQLVNVPNGAAPIPEAGYDFTTLIDAASAGQPADLRSHGLAAERVVLEGDLPGRSAR